MDQSEGQSKINIEHKQQKEDQQEYKVIGSSKKKVGQFLFGLDINKNEVYQIRLEVKKEFDITKHKEIGHYQVTVNPSHPLLYASNLRNAKRKFEKRYALRSLL